jgi:hypothetical protein
MKISKDICSQHNYILEKDGQLYESRVSWFRELSGLDQTMGYEPCHKSTEEHLAALQLGQPVPKELSGLMKMSAEQASEFCGQCHRTWAEIAAQLTRGLPIFASSRTG